MRKTYQPKKKLVERNWHLVDAKDQILGRVATKVVTYLMGKHKPSYSANIDSGDFVVIKNAETIKVSGNKEFNKVYASHSGYPGGYKEVSYAKMKKEFPERILEKAIFGMLPDNRLRSVRMNRLNIVVGEKHKYENKFK